MYTLEPRSKSAHHYMRNFLYKLSFVSFWSSKNSLCMEPSYTRKQSGTEVNGSIANFHHVFLRDNRIKGNMKLISEQLTSRTSILFIGENYSKYLSHITSPTNTNDCLLFMTSMERCFREMNFNFFRNNKTCRR